MGKLTWLSLQSMFSTRSTCWYSEAGNIASIPVLVVFDDEGVFSTEENVMYEKKKVKCIK